MVDDTIVLLGVGAVVLLGGGLLGKKILSVGGGSQAGSGGGTEEGDTAGPLYSTPEQFEEETGEQSVNYNQRSIPELRGYQRRGYSVQYTKHDDTAISQRYAPNFTTLDGKSIYVPPPDPGDPVNEPNFTTLSGEEIYVPPPAPNPVVKRKIVLWPGGGFGGGGGGAG